MPRKCSANCVSAITRHVRKPLPKSSAKLSVARLHWAVKQPEFLFSEISAFFIFRSYATDALPIFTVVVIAVFMRATATFRYTTRPGRKISQPPQAVHLSEHAQVGQSKSRSGL